MSSAPGTIVQRCTCGGGLNNKVCYSETFQRLVSSTSGCVKVVFMFWMVSLDVLKQQLGLSAAAISVAQRAGLITGKQTFADIRESWSWRG